VLGVCLSLTFGRFLKPEYIKAVFWKEKEKIIRAKKAIIITATATST